MRSKKPYVSAICKFFLFLGDVFEGIKKQLVRTEIVTCFARTENRSRFTINALNYIVLRPIISMLHTFNRSNPSSIMKRTTFSVVFFCKKTKLTKKGKAPIYARITTSGQISEIHTQCQAVPEYRNQRLERGLHAVTARYSPEKHDHRADRESERAARNAAGRC